MHKGNLQVGGGGALAGQDAVQQTGLLRLGGLVADLHGVILLQGQYIVPQGIQLFAQLARAGIGQLLHGVDAQQKQQHITRRDAESGSAVGQKRFLDPVVERHDLNAVLIAPLFIRPLAENLLQAGIAAGLGKGQQIGLGDGVIVHELVVHLDGGILAVLRHDADDIAQNAGRVKVFQHTDALVAFLHIEAAHILIAADGVADALFQMRQAEVDPLTGKLGLEVQQRHKVGCERCGAASRFGAHQQIQRDIHLAEGNLIFHRDILQDIVQYRQKRRLPGKHFLPVIAQCQLLGFQVQFISLVAVHSRSPPRFLYNRYKIIITHMCGIYKDFCNYPVCTAFGYTLYIRSLS